MDDGRGDEVDDVEPGLEGSPVSALPDEELEVDLGATIIGGAETADELRRLAEQARKDAAPGPDPRNRQTMMGSEGDVDQIRRLTEEAHQRARDVQAAASPARTADEEAEEIRRLTAEARARAGRGTVTSDEPRTPSAADTVWSPNPNPFPAVDHVDHVDHADHVAPDATAGKGTLPPAGFDLDAHRHGQLTPPATVAAVADAARPTPVIVLIAAGAAAALVVGLIVFALVSLL